MTFETIRELIIDIANCSEEEVQMETELKEGLGMDSLDAMELAMMVEERMGISIPEEKLAEIVKVSDIVNYIDSVQG